MSTIFNGITPRHSDLNPLKRLLCKVIIIRLEAVVTAGTCLAQAGQSVKSSGWKPISSNQQDDWFLHKGILL